MINIYKQPKSASIYANLFIQEIPDNVENVCLLFIGHLETIYDILVTKPDVNFTVIDGKDTIDALPYIYNGANLKLSITFEDSWCEDKETIVENLQSIFNNMSFDLIIANPPYGKRSSLSKKIVNALLENKVAGEMVVLAPPKTFYGILDHSKELKCVSSYLNKTIIFEDAAVEILYLDHIVSEKQNKYKESSDFLLDEKHKVFRNVVIEYNKTHSNGLEYKSWMCTLQGKEKGLFDSFEDSKIFLVPIFTPSPLNGVARQGESYEHNVLKKPIEYKKRVSAPFILYIKDDVHYNNFSSWWYSAKKRREGGLINFMFDILFILYGGDPSLLKYVEVIPNLDWSHPWTDAEILKEIGLPEDFLEKE